MNLADEIEKRIKALSEEPDHSKGGILLPWKLQAEQELTRYLNDQACNIVDALRRADVDGDADNERLNWLEAKRATVYRSSTGGTHWVIVDETTRDRRGVLGKDLRDAIDNARTGRANSAREE